MLGQELPIRCWTSPCGASLKPTSRIFNSLVNSAMVDQRRIKFGAASMFKAAVGQSSSHSVGIMAFSAAFELSVPSATSGLVITGLVITEDELGKYHEENRRKEAAQEKLAATEANKLKRSTLERPRPNSAVELFCWQGVAKAPSTDASGCTASTCW